MSNEIIKYYWQAESLCKKPLKYDRRKKEFTYFSLSDFYAGIGKTTSPQVKQLCNDCPVKKECLDHALHHEKYGFWGGTTEKQRKIIRKREGIIYQAPQTEY